MTKGGWGGDSTKLGNGRGLVLKVKMELLLFLSQHTGHATTLMVYIQYGGNKHATSKKTKTLENLTSILYSFEICTSSWVISKTTEIMWCLTWMQMTMFETVT